LSDKRRPRGIAIALVRREAREARGAPRLDDRSHRHAAAVEHDGHVRHVAGHQLGGNVRGNMMLRDQHHRIARGRGAGCRPGGGDPGGAERLGDIAARRRVDAVGGPELHGSGCRRAVQSALE
jgi:hypothetical protein